MNHSVLRHRHHHASLIRRYLNRFLFALAIPALSLVVPSVASADSDTPGQVIAGYVEKITLLENGHELKAKLDSGTNTSSIYAVDVEEFERGDDDWVRFTLVLDDDDEPLRLKLERKRERLVRIVAAGEEGDSRKVVSLQICFNGRPYSTQFTLADREGLIYPVLLGRSFLSGLAMIDTAKTFLTKSQCDSGKVEIR